MTEEEYDLFCTHCGMRITKDTVFCPSCGAQVSWAGEGSPANNVNQYNDRRARDMSGRLKGISILLVITAVIFVAMGIYYLASIDATIDAMKADTTSWSNLVSMVEDYGYDEAWLVDLLRTTLLALGVTSLIAGIAAAVSAVCGFTKKYWFLGVLGCAIATIMTATTILGIIVGIIVTYLYYTTKPCFQQ